MRAFEDAGARATLDMQRAAREVAWVNARLLELLAAKGVAGAEVDGFLRRCREEEKGKGEEIGSGSGSGFIIADRRGAGAGKDAGENTVCQRDGDGGGSDAGGGGGGGSRALVTSCDDAANIIAGFQGHGDISRVRTALGCGDAAECHVKNTRLFQLMDETG